ncbi:MAG: phytoene/squalene synthase family protein [Acidobacteriia bacterium]|nr:phytoene/squalene synthase family protein [Terriglobia bacterium]
MTVLAQTGQVPSAPRVAPLQLRTAYGICRHITRKAARNFYYAFLVLPRRKRDALSAVYAFMRQADDISDDPQLTPEDKRLKLNAWLDSLHRAVAGEPTDDPVLMAVADSQRRFKIPTELLETLVYGTAMDVPWPGRQQPMADGPQVLYQTFDDLYNYCYHVASVVGLVCIYVFGYRDPAAEDLAERCGVAFQLTNIIRDVKEDAAMGRIYLPRQDLDRCGIGASMFRAPRPTLFRPLLEMEAERARQYYVSGRQLIAYVDEDSQPALWTLVEIYSRLLAKIADRNYDVFTERVCLSTGEKLRVLTKGMWRRIVS